MQTLCFHCDLEVPEGENYVLPVSGEDRQFCCPGCLAIAQTICENKLEQFYQFRTQKNAKPQELLPQEILQMEALDNPVVLDLISSDNQQTRTIELGIEGITCAACGWLIRRKISQRVDVESIQVNTATRRALLQIKHDALLSPILKNIHQLGYYAYPFAEDTQEKNLQREAATFNRRLIIAGLAMMQVMMFATGLYLGDYQDISREHAYFLQSVSGLLATPVVFYSALPFFKNAWNGLKHRHFGMNLPVSLAIISGYVASIYSLFTHGEVYYFDSVVMFTFFLLLGRYLEQRTRLKAVLKQQNFKRLLPVSVTRQKDDGSVETIPTQSILPGDRIIVNAGCVVPIDGVLIDSEAELNEAILTGEFLPVSKRCDDKIYSGSTNSGAGFVMRAITTIDQCRLQQLIQLQQDSENINSSRVTLADRVANGYVLALLVLCVLVGIYWYQTDPTRTFPIVLSLLVVSCPCALSLATPAAVAAAIAKLTDFGLMIKSTDFLQKLARTTDIYFDKTGTLTLGKMQLLKTLVHADYTQQYCLDIAAAMETISAHPIADAFKLANINPLNIDAQEIIASGIIGKLNDETYYLGKREFVEQAANSHVLSVDLDGQEDTAQLMVFLFKDQQHIATFLLADTINPSASSAIRLLADTGINITLLSGDSNNTCTALANTLEITSSKADQTPEAKLATIVNAKSNDSTIMMVGDGVNDIGAMAQADISISMGSASHLSRAASSAVLLSLDLTTIYQAIITARKLENIIKQNLTWAVVYNCCAIPVAAMGLVPAWLAAIGMTGSSLIVVLNALRLRA